AEKASQQTTTEPGVVGQAEARTKVGVIRIVVAARIVRRTPQAVTHQRNGAESAHALSSGSEPRREICILVDRGHGFEAVDLIGDGVEYIAQPVGYGQIRAQ